MMDVDDGVLLTEMVVCGFHCLRVLRELCPYGKFPARLRHGRVMVSFEGGRGMKCMILCGRYFGFGVFGVEGRIGVIRFWICFAAPCQVFWVYEG